METSQHQTEIQINNLTFFSSFDSGNLMQVSKVGQFSYELAVAPDAYLTGQTHYRIWFYFGIRGLTRGQSIRLTITNLSPSKAVVSPTYRPVFRELPKNPTWQRLPTDCRHDTLQSPNCRLSWVFHASDVQQTVFFAFAPPYTYENIMDMVGSLDRCIPPSTYYHSEILTYSPQGRIIPLLTITDCENTKLNREEVLPGLFPEHGQRSLHCKKPIIFMSARVHPGETPASFFLEAFLKFLLSKDKRAEILRRTFVFKIVPIINADGVFLGHFRVDQFGVNLNRSYINPSAEREPAVFAVKHYVQYLNQEAELYFYLDIHSQSSKRSCWVFGNALDIDDQIENQMFAKLVGLNCAYFEYNDCDFSERSMQYKDPKDIHSKEGSARVSVFKDTGLVHSYTLECPHYCPQPLYKIAALLPTDGKRIKGRSQIDPLIRCVPCYNHGMFTNIADGVAMTFLDMKSVNLSSRLVMSNFKGLDGMREHIRAKILIGMRVKKSRQVIAPKEVGYRALKPWVNSNVTRS